MTEYQYKLAEVKRQENKNAIAEMLVQIAERYDGIQRKIIESYAVKELTGEHLLPLPLIQEFAIGGENNGTSTADSRH